MENDESVDDGFPSELKDRLSNFDDCLTEIEDILKQLHDIPHNELQAKMSSLDRAKLDLLGAYAMNSLFWVYLNTKGENPKEHGIKQELDRIKTYMGRVKDIEDRAKAPKLDKGAAKRFIRSALWHAAHQGAAQKEEASSSTPIKAEVDSPSTSQNNEVKDSEQNDDEIPAKKTRLEELCGEQEIKKREKKKKKRKDNVF